MPNNIVVNCGFEEGNFNHWDLEGDLSFTGVADYAANSGDFGAFFGAIGDFNFLTYNFHVIVGQNYHLEFWLANQAGGTPNEVKVRWVSGLFDVTVLDLVDQDPSDWTLYTFGPLPTDDFNSRLEFSFRHDPDFWYLDDVDIELQSAGPAPAALSDHQAERGAGNAQP